MSLFKWISPSKIDLPSPFQVKKIFDLREFAEATRGYPLIINYSWQEIRKSIETDFSYDSDYWSPHFNYLNTEKWHEYIEEPNTRQQTQQYTNLMEQVKIKIESLQFLKEHFQESSPYLIYPFLHPTPSADINRPLVPLRYHRIARFWAIYSKYTAITDDKERIEIRTTFPEVSISSLEAAKVSSLQQTNRNHVRTTRDDRQLCEFEYEFDLTNLSKNTKFDKNDTVYLIPFQIRYWRMNRDWEIIISDISTDIQGNLSVQARTKNAQDTCIIQQYNNLHQKYTYLDQNPEWFLFPWGFDNWSTKLFENRDALLTRYNFGRSHLGHLLSYKWDLSQYPDSDPLQEFEANFSLQEVFMYSPSVFTSIEVFQVSKLLTTISPPPNPSQEEGIKNALGTPISGIIGPPGTGKSKTLTVLVDEYIRRWNQSRQGAPPLRILVTANSYKALEVLVKKFSDAEDSDRNPVQVTQIPKIFIRSPRIEELPREISDDLYFIGDKVFYNGQRLYRNRRGNRYLDDVFTRTHNTPNFIIFANTYSLYKMGKPGSSGGRYTFFNEDFSFNLIIVDEASQIPTDHFLSSLLFLPRDISIRIRENTNQSGEVELVEIYGLDQGRILPQIVVAGDSNQLPPVRKIKIAKKLKPILGSLFTYYIDNHSIPKRSLRINYRSNRQIIQYTNSLPFYPEEIVPKYPDRQITGDISRITNDWVKEILDGNKMSISLVHNTKFESKISNLEAELVVELVIGFYEMSNPTNIDEEINFWEKQLGVVAPHNAQGRLIIRKLAQRFQNITTSLISSKIDQYLRAIVVSVEKFQGSDRDLIIATMGISSRDQLQKEEEFIYDLSRFNVLTSRPKGKMIVIFSEEFLRYIPTDPEIIPNATNIRNYALKHCNIDDPTNYFQIPDPESPNDHRTIKFRYRDPHL